MQTTLPRSIDYLSDLFDFLQIFFVRHGIPRSISFPVSLAAEEIFTNCVKYNPEGGDDIAVHLEHKGGYLELTIVDPGPEFDPNLTPAVKMDIPLKERKVGGLGIHLVRQLMDKMEYHYKYGQNIIILRKNLETENV